jgi:hypothetical protein
MKNMKNYYRLTGVLCVALIGGLVSSVSNADDKVSRAADHILLYNKSQDAVICAFVPTDTQSGGTALQTPEGFNDDATRFARQFLRWFVVQSGEKRNVHRLPEGDYTSCLWIAAANRRGQLALEDALYSTGKVAAFEPIQVVAVDGSYVTLADKPKRDTPYDATVRGKLGGSILNSWSNLTEKVVEKAGEARDVLYGYGELTAEKARKLFDATKDYAIGAKEYVQEKAHAGIEKGKQKAHEVAEKGREVRTEMTLDNAYDAIGLTHAQKRDLKNYGTLAKYKQEELVANIEAAIKKAKIDGKKNAEIAGARLKKHFEELKNALNS